MFVNYHKDVSTLLAMISCIKENDTEIQKAKRALLPQSFAFGQANYSSHLTYQHTLMKVHCIQNTSYYCDYN